MPYTYQQKLALKAHHALCKAKYSRFETARLEQHVQRLDARVIKTDSLAVISVNTNNSSDSLGHNRTLIADIRSSLLSKIVESEQIAERVEKQINAIQSDLDRLVLKKYYLDGMSIDQIASELHFSKSHINQVKRRALIEYYKISNDRRLLS